MNRKCVIKLSRLIFILGSFLNSQNHAKTFILSQGEHRILPAQGIYKILSGNKKVLNIKDLKLKNKSISITGKAPGRSSLSLIGHDRTITHQVIVLSKKIDDYYRHILKKITRHHGINIDCNHNKIFLSGTIKDFNSFKEILALTNGKATIINDIRLEPETVKFEAQQIMKLLRKLNLSDFELRYHPEFNKIIITVKGHNKDDDTLVKNILSPYEAISIMKFIKIPNTEKIIRLDVEFVEFKDGLNENIGFIWNKGVSILPLERNINLFLSAQTRSGKAKIIASPKLVCASGGKAQFLAGGQIPLRIISPEHTRVEWKRYGIELSFSPLLVRKEIIDLDISITISDLDYSNAIENLPAISSRKVETHISIENERTFFISGLIKNTSGKNVEKIPFLGSIPILGELFKSRSFLDKKSELIVLITPRIADTEVPNLNLKIQQFDNELKGSLYD